MQTNGCGGSEYEPCEKSMVANGSEARSRHGARTKDCFTTGSMLALGDGTTLARPTEVCATRAKTLTSAKSRV